jgi:hypothetical protein
MTQPTNRGFRLPGALGRAQLATQGNPKKAVEQLPKTVGGGFGSVPAAPIDTTKDVPAATPKLTPAQAQTLMMAELNAAVRSLVESSTELAGRLGRRGAVNSILESWAGVFPASGVITRTYEVAAGSLSIENLSATHSLIVTTGVAAGDTGANTSGVGVSYVRANSRGLSPVADHSFTITGTAGDSISFEVFTGLQAYGVDTP